MRTVSTIIDRLDISGRGLVSGSRQGKGDGVELVRRVDGGDRSSVTVNVLARIPIITQQPAIMTHGHGLPYGQSFPAVRNRGFKRHLCLFHRMHERDPA